VGVIGNNVGGLIVTKRQLKALGDRFQVDFACVLEKCVRCLSFCHG